MFGFKLLALLIGVILRVISADVTVHW